MADPSHAPTPDRRPIASREWPVFRRLAAALVSLRVSANGISIAGMVAGVGAGVALAATAHTNPTPAHLLWVLAAALIQFRLLANMLDGMVALASGKLSPLGELYNEVPDRISDAATLIGLGYAAHSRPELGYLGACLAILTAYIRAVGKAAGAGSDFRGPMAKQQRMATVTLAALFMAAAPEAWRRGWCPFDASLGPPAAALALIILGAAITVVRRLLLIASRLRALKATP